MYQGFSLLTANRGVLVHPEVVRIAKKYGKAVTQVVFRFALQVGMIALTGTTDPEHMRMDLEVGDFDARSGGGGADRAVGGRLRVHRGRGSARSLAGNGLGSAGTGGMGGGEGAEAGSMGCSLSWTPTARSREARDWPREVSSWAT